VLVVVFSSVLDLGIDNFPAFVFTGLIAWTWFGTGVGNATSSLLDRRHLVYQPRFPTIVLPVVSVTVPLIDALMALPVLFAMLATGDDLHATLAFVPVLLLVQLVLMCGIGWICAAVTVYFRDVQQIVGVGLVLLFYLTPVFYTLERVPEKYHWLLRINPLTTLVDSYHQRVVEGRMPAARPLVIVAAGSVLLAVLGVLLFRRLGGGLGDEV